MNANRGFLEIRRSSQSPWKAFGWAFLAILGAGLVLLLAWFAFKHWKDGRNRKRTMEEENKKLFRKEHPLNEDRSGFTPPEPEDLEGDVPPAQEASFLNMRTLIIGAAGLIVMIVFVHVLAGGLIGIFSILNPFGIAPPPGQPGNVPLPEVNPAAPTLQVDYFTDLQRVQTTQEGNINSYGWVDREEGLVRIPIERAIELVAQVGLPVTTTTPQGGVGEPDNSGFGFATPEP